LTVSRIYAAEAPFLSGKLIAQWMILGRKFQSFNGWIGAPGENIDGRQMLNHGTRGRLTAS